VKAALATAKKSALVAAGFYENGVAYRAVGNSKGNFGFHIESSAEFTATMRTADGTGSGWASATSTRLSDVNPQVVATRAADKGLASAKPRDVAPGDYTVILEPAAVANLLQAMQFSALSARAADEGRSVFSKEGGGNRLGEKVAHESVTLATDPFDARVPGLPWAINSGGLPNRKVTWIEKGILKTLATERYWGKATGKEPTPPAASLVMAGGAQTLDDLIASTERGLLVTRFWYIRATNPQTAHLTGLTRDGLFLIEQGKIAYPVTNLRFNESPVVMLQNVLGMTTAVPAAGMVLPAIKSTEFTFTSKSDAV
jgi:predicted Zn-dependent protease